MLSAGKQRLDWSVFVCFSRPLKTLLNVTISSASVGPACTTDAKGATVSILIHGTTRWDEVLPRLTGTFSATVPHLPQTSLLPMMCSCNSGSNVGKYTHVYDLWAFMSLDISRWWLRVLVPDHTRNWHPQNGQSGLSLFPKNQVQKNFKWHANCPKETDSV